MSDRVRPIARVKRSRRAAVLVVAGALLLAGCSGDADSPDEAGGDEYAEGDQGVEEGEAEEDAEDEDEDTDADGDGQDQPSGGDHGVASVFGDAAWSVPGQPYVATHDHLYLFTEDEITAVSASGDTVWEADVAGGPDASMPMMGYEDYPQVRLLDGGNVVAHLKAGSTDGDGLSESSGAAQVTLLDGQDGSVIDTVEVDGCQDVVPEPSIAGLVFTANCGFGSDDVTTTVVHADGTSEEPSEPVVAIVGDTTLTGTEYEYDLAGPDWTVEEVLGAGEGGTQFELQDTDGDDLLLFDSQAGPTTTTAVVRASTGESLGETDCSVPVDERFTHSLNGEYAAIGPLLITSDGVECIGDGDDEKAVRLRVILDDGTAFGIATADDNSMLGHDEFLIYGPDGEATIEDIPDALPVGIVDGGLVLHESSEMSAHPVN